jgi:phage terminase large subunit
MGQIEIPYKFKAREYQTPLIKAMEEGKKRACVVWHRRSGKDKTIWNFTISRAVQQKGIYYYLFPYTVQARRALWEAIGKDGVSFLDHLPKDLVTNINNTEMRVELWNGSIIRVMGTDNIDAVVGANPIGAVFSEYSLQNPMAWDLIRPILSENGGWAIFNFTPRGWNHGKDLYQMAKTNPNWYSEILTVKDTKREDGTAVITDEAIQEERDAGMSEEMILQEFFCSFNGAVESAYYGAVMNQLEQAGQILDLPYDPAMQVVTAWDLGYDDSMTIWFFQHDRGKVRVIDYYENVNKGLPHYAKVLKEKPYVYEAHIMPHDIEVHEIGSGLTRKETAESMGIRPIHVAPRQDVLDGINAVRMKLPLCFFDKERCKKGINALISYSKEYDEEKRVHKEKPRHDWASHGADAFRTYAMGWQGSIEMAPLKLKRMRCA